MSSIDSIKISEKCLFAPENEFVAHASKFPTPFYVYDEATIRKTCRDFKAAFSWAPKFTNYFAVKATPSPHILAILREEGFGADCSSLAELVLAESVGFTGEEIFFTSNNTPICEYEKAKELGAVLNLDDISHIDYIHESIGLPDLICLRYNPGHRRNFGNNIIGSTINSKFGMTYEQILEAYEKCKAYGVKRFALHTMVISNSLDEAELVETTRMMFELVVEIEQKLGIRIEIVNMGGGFGIPYKPMEKALNLEELSKSIHSQFHKQISANGLSDLRVVFECGRFITGPAGCLATRIIHQKDTYKQFIGVDANMANLMRPALYNAYHHMTLIQDPEFRKNKIQRHWNIFEGKSRNTGVYDVVGSLCENNDKLAVDRDFGQEDIHIGDLIVIHDTGAHGHSMGFNYNGKLRGAEYLRNAQGNIICIRRAETLEDLFCTLTDPSGKPIRTTVQGHEQFPTTQENITLNTGEIKP